MPNVRLSPAARRDLQAIWSYTRKTWGLEQADRYIDSLAETFDTLARSPESAPACDHIRPGYRHRRVERHVVYFKIATDGIVVVRVLHERMDAPRRI
jgi:toxin ParE1/3/4